MNERIVELPIARAMMEGVQAQEILEVGNVLSHYDASASHTVIDKYEPTGRAGCFLCDVLGFHPERKYRLILSLSTLEHVGWDEIPVELEKASLAILHLKSLLAPDGVLFLTIPLGYHPTLEDLFFENRVPDADAAFLLRTSSANEWAEVEAKEARGVGFGTKYPFANGIIAARVHASGGKLGFWSAFASPL
jgi:hypothetical protein